MSTPKTLTVTECHQLLDALLPKNNTQTSFRKGLRNYTMALLMLDAGLRVGEVVALQMSDLYYGGVPVENVTIRAEISKNKTERVVPLSERVRNALVTLWTECSYFADRSSTEYIFTIWLRNKPLTTRQVERIIRAAAIRSIGRPIHPHILRHTFATRLMRKTNARIVQELLGHSQMSSTQIYMNPNSDDLKKAIDSVVEEKPEQLPKGMQMFSPDRPADRVDAARTDHDHS